MKKLLAVVTSAGLLRLCFPPFHVWPLAFVALVPLLLVLRRSRVLASTAYGFVFGASANLLLGFGPGVVAAKRFAPLSTVEAVGFVVCVLTLQGVREAFAAGTASAARAFRVTAYAAFPISFCVAELAIRPWFPWPLALAVSSEPLAYSVAHAGGSVLVSTILVACNAAIAAGYDRMLAGDRRAASLTFAASLSSLLLLCAYGATRRFLSNHFPVSGLTSVVGLSQPSRERRGQIAPYLQSGERLVERGADLLVWSESSTPQGLPVGALESLLRKKGDETRNAGVVLGAIVTDKDGHHRNAALSFDERGRFQDRHDKVNLFPFGETGALGRGLPLAARESKNSIPIEAGFNEAPISVDAHRANQKALIALCYEDIVPSGIWFGPGKSDAGALFVLANDSWFDGTSGIDLHFAHARLRAVERGRFVVRAATSGTSGIINPLGGVAFQLPRDAEAEGISKIQWLDGGTLYERVGALPALLLGLSFAFQKHLGFIYSKLRRRLRHLSPTILKPVKVS